MHKRNKWLMDLPVKHEGTYVVITACGRWGRGDTLAQAVQEARSCGAKSLAKPNVAVFWQPNASWLDARTVHGNPDADRPFIGSDGALYSWGGKVETLHRPTQLEVV